MFCWCGGDDDVCWCCKCCCCCRCCCRWPSRIDEPFILFVNRFRTSSIVRFAAPLDAYAPAVAKPTHTCWCSCMNRSCCCGLSWCSECALARRAWWSSKSLVCWCCCCGDVVGDADDIISNCRDSGDAGDGLVVPLPGEPTVTPASNVNSLEFTNWWLLLLLLCDCGFGNAFWLVFM